MGGACPSRWEGVHSSITAVSNGFSEHLAPRALAAAASPTPLKRTGAPTGPVGVPLAVRTYKGACSQREASTAAPRLEPRLIVSRVLPGLGTGVRSGPTSRTTTEIPGYWLRFTTRSAVEFSTGKGMSLRSRSRAARGTTQMLRRRISLATWTRDMARRGSNWRSTTSCLAPRRQAGRGPSGQSSTEAGGQGMTSSSRSIQPCKLPRRPPSVRARARSSR